MGLLAAELPMKGDIWVWHPFHSGRGNKNHRGPMGTRLYQRWEVMDDPISEHSQDSRWIRIHLRNVDTGMVDTEYTVGAWYVWDDHWRILSRNGITLGRVRFVCGACGSTAGSDQFDYLCMECRSAT